MVGDASAGSLLMSTMLFRIVEVTPEAAAASGTVRFVSATLPVALCAPDKLRGSLTAAAAAAAMASGLRDAGFEPVELPLADGGEGTLEALLAACGGERRETTVTGPDGGEVAAAWGLLEDGTAVVELAQASGLALVEGANDPVTATTRGTGELIAAAARAGAARVVLGVGGSATVDGGLGALEALGWTLPVPVTVACDVETGFVEAAEVFAPQKGATADEVAFLERRLHDLALRYRRRTGIDVRALAGAGAAGGIAGGLAAFGARLRPGFDVVAEACRFHEHLAAATLVLTGEGRLDRTSLAGKVVGRVLTAAAETETRAGVIVGAVADGLGPLPGAPPVIALTRVAASVDEAFRNAAELVRAAAARIGRGC